MAVCGRKVGSRARDVAPGQAAGVCCLLSPRKVAESKGRWEKVNKSESKVGRGGKVAESKGRWEKVKKVAESKVGRGGRGYESKGRWEKVGK